MEQNTKKGIAFAVLAAALYAINAPFSKLLLEFVPPTLMAGFLYIGAGVGMMVIAFIKKVRKSEAKEQPLTKSELPYTIAMILLDITAPIFLLLGLNATTAANVSLLNNFEIVATAIIALMVFKEHISARLWLGILFVTLSCGILSFEDVSSLRFSYGSLFVLLAAVCWGFENNCTRKISSRDPLQIVLLKGIFSGIGSVIIGLSIGERTTSWGSIMLVMLLGFVAYGLSIYFYVYAQRLLGAAQTSAYYAVAPFIAAILSLIVFREFPDITYFTALGLMIVGAWLSSQDKPLRIRKHRKAIFKTIAPTKKPPEPLHCLRLRWFLLLFLFIFQLIIGFLLGNQPRRKFILEMTLAFLTLSDSVLCAEFFHQRIVLFAEPLG